MIGEDRLNWPFGCKFIQLTFLKSFFPDVFFDCILGYKAVNVDLLSLSNSVTAILCLRINGRVPVRVIENDSIRSLSS